MKKRKNILLLILMLTASCVLAACGSALPAGRSPVDDVSASIEETLPTEEASDSKNVEPARESGAAEPDTAETEKDAKILIAYYSHTGNTEEAAQKIAEFTGGDLAEIQRAEEYGDVYKEAEAEILDGIHPEITISADNIEEYNTIFVGYAGGIIGLN